MPEPLVLLQPVFGRNGITMTRAAEDLGDGFISFRLGGPWRQGQVRLHTPEASDAAEFRLELEIDIPMAADEEAADGLPSVIDPDTVVRMAALTCQNAFEAFFEEEPAAEEVLDPDASGAYAREVTIAGITETVAIELMVGCDVLAEDADAAIPQAGKLLCFVLATLRAETPFLDGRPGRSERRRKGRR